MGGLVGVCEEADEPPRPRALRTVRRPELRALTGVWTVMVGVPGASRYLGPGSASVEPAALLPLPVAEVTSCVLEYVVAPKVLVWSSLPSGEGGLKGAVGAGGGPSPPASFPVGAVDISIRIFSQGFESEGLFLVWL